MLCLLWLTACDFNPTGIQLAPGWGSHSLSAWHNHDPDMMVVSRDGKWLYVSCETNASLLAPSLLSVNMETGHQHTLLFGLHKAATLKMAPDGSLWLGEAFDDGLFWRITEPEILPDDQRVDRASLESSTAAIAPLHRVGNFKHNGLTFSKDGRYAYLADAWEEGAVYRYGLRTHQLQVLHQEKGWLPITDTKNARVDAETLHAQYFNRIEGMETLPDGRILMAENQTGRILMLDDTKPLPKVTTWLQNNALKHPENLVWDVARGWLWITDDDKSSYLWAWDGRDLRDIAHHDSSKIRGVTLHGSDVYINLQPTIGQAEVMLRLSEKQAPKAL